MSQREQEISLIQRMFGNEVDRLLTRLETVSDPVLYERASRDAQREFNRLDAWFYRSLVGRERE